VQNKKQISAHVASWAQSGHADCRIECPLLGCRGKADVSHGVFYEYVP
jgi:hypothetical protein